MDQLRRDEDSFRRRKEVLALPVVGLRRHGRVARPDDPVTMELGLTSASAVGVGPDGELVAYWSSPRDDAIAAVTFSRTGSRDDTTTLLVRDPPKSVHKVQPMPGGSVLLSATRDVGDDGPAGIWNPNGDRVQAGHLGAAIAHLLTTPSGQIWVGYFDEASGLRGYPTGIARFDASLGETWRYRHDSGMPDHFDCYALNVDDETATTYAYTAWHLTRIGQDDWTDLGPAPHHGASALMIDGDRTVLIGGYGADYDLITPLRIDPDGIRRGGPSQRLVLPDGLEVHGPRVLVGRGADLHVIHQRAWHRLDLGSVAFD